MVVALSQCFALYSSNIFILLYHMFVYELMDYLTRQAMARSMDEEFIVMYMFMFRIHFIAIATHGFLF